MPQEIEFVIAFIIVAAGLVIIVVLLDRAGFLTGVEENKFRSLFTPGKIIARGGNPDGSFSPNDIEVIADDCSTGLQNYKVKLADTVVLTGLAHPEDEKITLIPVLTFNQKTTIGRDGNGNTVEITCKRSDDGTFECGEGKKISEAIFDVEDEQSEQEKFFHFSLWRNSEIVKREIGGGITISRLINDYFSYYLATFGIGENNIGIQGKCWEGFCKKRGDESRFFNDDFGGTVCLRPHPIDNPTGNDGQCDWYTESRDGWCSKHEMCYFNTKQGTGNLPEICQACPIPAKELCKEFSLEQCGMCGTATSGNTCNYYRYVGDEDKRCFPESIIHADQQCEEECGFSCSLEECSALKATIAGPAGPTQVGCFFKSAVFGDGGIYDDKCQACNPEFTCEDFSPEQCTDNQNKPCGLECKVRENKITRKEQCMSVCREGRGCEQFNDYPQDIDLCTTNPCGLSCQVLNGVCTNR